MAIEELKKENATLKQQLSSVSEDMKKMKDTSASCVPRAKLKLPPIVSVSLPIATSIFDHYHNVYGVVTCDICLP